MNLWVEVRIHCALTFYSYFLSNVAMNFFQLSRTRFGRTFNFPILKRFLAAIKYELSIKRNIVAANVPHKIASRSKCDPLQKTLFSSWLFIHWLAFGFHDNFFCESILFFFLFICIRHQNNINIRHISAGVIKLYCSFKCPLHKSKHWTKEKILLLWFIVTVFLLA